MPIDSVFASPPGLSQRRRLPKADLSIGCLGFGAASLGNLYRAIDESTAKAAIDAAAAAGICYFDTAPRYGHGLSERRLGAFGLPDDAILSTKVGRTLYPIPAPPPGTERHGFVDADPFEESFDYSYDGILKSFEQSLKRLQRDTLDVVYVHDIGALTHADAYPQQRRLLTTSGVKALDELKACGRVKAIGLGVNEIEVCLDLLQDMELDTLMLAGRYTLLEPTKALPLFKRCEALGVAVVSAAPFNSGILSKPPGADGARYNYEAAAPETVARVHALAELCQEYEVELPAAALQFPLRSKAVYSVVVGMGSTDSVVRNIDNLTSPIPEAFWQAFADRFGQV